MEFITKWKKAYKWKVNESDFLLSNPQEDARIAKIHYCLTNKNWEITLFTRYDDATIDKLNECRIDKERSQAEALLWGKIDHAKWTIRSPMMHVYRNDGLTWIIMKYNIDSRADVVDLSLRRREYKFNLKPSVDITEITQVKQLTQKLVETNPLNYNLFINEFYKPMEWKATCKNAFLYTQEGSHEFIARIDFSAIQQVWCIYIGDSEKITLYANPKDVDRIKELTEKLVHVKPSEYKEILENHDFNKSVIC